MLLIIIGLFIRIAPVTDWQATPEKYFSNHQPLITTGDGYYYLSIARDIVDGSYEQTDDKRAVPVPPSRSPVPPLLSLITATISQATGFSLNWIAVILPALLGILLALPLHGIGRIIGGTPMALTSVGVALFSSSYVMRSSLGKFDTDCLIVTLTFASVYFFMRFAIEKGYIRYLYFSAGLICWLFFSGWWDQAPLIATLISAWPLLMALLFYYRPAKREGFIFSFLCAALGLMTLYQAGFDLPLRIWHTLQGHLTYLLKKPAVGFPSVGVLVTEQQNYTLAEIISITTNSPIVFYLALVGFILLCIRQFNKAIFLFIPFLLTCLSIFYANRFLVFLGPVAGLSLGFLATEIWQRYHRNKYIYILPIFILYALWSCLVSPIPIGTSTPFPAASINGMRTIQDITPENAVIWSWWDNGYPLNYWADRATICDGQFHDGEITIFNALPLASDDPKQAANFMNFYIHRGRHGMQTLYSALDKNSKNALLLIKKVMEAGPDGAKNIIKTAGLQPVANMQTTEEWLRFFFPQQKRLLYIFIDFPQIKNSHWISWLGSWDPTQQDGIHTIAMKARHGISLTGMNLNTRGGQLQGDLQKGIATYKETNIPLSSAAVSNGNKTIMYNYGKHPVKAPDVLAANLQQNSSGTEPLIEGTYHLEISLQSDTAILMGQDIAATNLHTMFWRGQALQSHYFIPVIEQSPDYQIWKVQPDQLTTH